MKVIISDYRHNPEFIVHARQSIMKGLLMDPNGPGKDPLPYGIYLYGYEKGEEHPSALGEIYLYPKKFEKLEDAVYSQAYDLSHYGTLNDFGHLRSLFIEENHKKGMLYMHLTVGLGFIAHELGASYLTAGTHSNKRDNIEQFKKSKMVELGEFQVEGEPHTLLLSDLKEFLTAFKNDHSLSILQYNLEFLKEIAKK